MPERLQQNSRATTAAAMETDHMNNQETDESYKLTLEKFCQVDHKASQYSELLRKYPSIVNNIKLYHENMAKYYRFQLTNLISELTKLEKTERSAAKPSNECARRGPISQSELQAMSNDAKKQYFSRQVCYMTKLTAQLNERFKKKRPIGPGPSLHHVSK